MYKKMTRSELLEIASEWGGTAFYIFIGGGVKLAYASRSKDISKKVVIITFIFAVFAGIIVNQIMLINGWVQYSGIATCIAALLGDSLVTYLLTNSNNIFRSFMNAVFKIDVKNDER